MKLKFTTPHDQQRGAIASLLKRSYTVLVQSDSEHWGPEVPKWEEFDREVFEHPDTVGSCVFLSWADDQIVGFGSYDPRQKPAFGIVGHNCILPDYRGRGFGKEQIWEILRRFQAYQIKLAKVSTNDHPFFVSAQRMYAACGFHEIRRHPWDGDMSQNVIEYEMELANTVSQPIAAKRGSG